MTLETKKFCDITNESSIVKTSDWSKEIDILINIILIYKYLINVNIFRNVCLYSIYIPKTTRPVFIINIPNPNFC